MARTFLTAVNLAKNELQNAAVQSLAAPPSAPAKFQLYGNTGDNTLYWWDGTTWVPAKGSGGAGFPGYGSVPAETTFGLAKADGVATTVARSDHTHGSPTHTDADHAAIHLNALAAPTADVSMGMFKLTNVAAPTLGFDAVNLNTLNSMINGLAWKSPVRAATTANITLSGNQTIDGVLVLTNERVLVKNQTTASQNGVYVVQSGAWTRATDIDQNIEFPNAAVFVSAGTQADTAWVCTNDTVVVGTTAVTWVQFSGGGAVVAGAGLTQTGNTIDVVAGDTTLTVAADDVRVNTGVIATVASLAGYQPIDTDLTALAANSANGLWARTGTGTGAAREITAALPITVINGDGVFGNPTLDINVFGGVKGVVPAVAVPSGKFLKDDGTWATPSTLVKYSTAVGGATTQVVNHALNTRDVVVELYRNSAPYDTVVCDVERTDANNVTLRFTAAPAASEYRVVVMA